MDHPASEDTPFPTRVSRRLSNLGTDNVPSVSVGTGGDLDLSMRAVEPIDVSVRDLKVSIITRPSTYQRLTTRISSKGRDVPDTKRVILNRISAQMPCGSLSAIIGGSGSGKTTMLNVMADRMYDSRLHVTGSSTYNGQGLSTIRWAYVMQSDVLVPTLTVRETLQYSADLRLPSPTTTEERRRVVQEVILELGLKECANTRIGNTTHKGCSGGERRRTSIGVQLLANPSVLFLDEPTTGLDATSAFQLMATLRNLAKNGRTVITTIHQPRSEIWGLIDHLVILTRGACVYSGPTVACLPYFESLGYPLPSFMNPAEYLVDVAAVDDRTSELESVSMLRVDRLIVEWQRRSEENGGSTENTNPYASPTITGKSVPAPFRAPMLRQIQVLTARTFKVTCRDPLGLAGSLFEAASMAIVTGWIFLSLDGSLAGIRSREGALYIASSLQGYLILLYETYRLTIDIELFDRERGEGVVGVASFLVSRRLARFLIEDIPVPLLFSVIFYFMAGFRAEPAQFFIFFAIVLVNQYIAVSFAMLCVAVSRNFAGASLVANLGYTIQSLACGYYVQASTIPIWVRWVKWTAYVFYAFGAMCANEFAGRFYDCPAPGGFTNPACKEYDGDFILDSLSVPNDWVTRPIGACFAFAVAFYIGSAFVLRYWKVQMSISRARPTEAGRSAGQEQLTARSRHDDLRTVDIVLARYALDIEKRTWRGMKRDKLSIVQPVNARFQPGHLNVIMGPSGSGKTSLLNSMARRLQSTFWTKYCISGRMLYNNEAPADSVIRSICCFLQQDDDALLPSLTVRETLCFAAGLRLPSWMSREEKEARAERQLLKMGLKDCADNLIGGELIKGISGGEKRRVSIAVQILTEPRVLLLDEPTSGLDAFTASSIIEVLKGLAEEGRTVILTIHQSRSDVFQQFGNVLLLARGGFPVYSGVGSGMLSYFETLGYTCPQNTNPADFALDLISVDLRGEKREAVSREKVRSLIHSWYGEDNALAPVGSIVSPAELGGLKRKVAPFRIAFPLLLRRGYINFRRQPAVVIGRIMQVLGFGIVLTLFFAPLQNDYYSVQSRVGFIQEFTALYFVGMLQNVAVYPTEKDVFYREHDDHVYSVEAFFLQYTVIEVPFEVITSLLFAVLTVLAAGLPRTATLYFVVALNCFCIVNCGESLGIMFNTLFAHTGFAVNVTSVVLSIATMLTGVLSLNVPGFLQAFNHLSPLKYSLANLAPYSLRGQIFTCTDFQRLPDGRCPIETGEQVLRLYNLDTNAGLNLAAMGIATVAYRALAYALLKGKKTHWRGWWEKRRQEGKIE